MGSNCTAADSEDSKGFTHPVVHVVLVTFVVLLVATCAGFVYRLCIRHECRKHRAERQEREEGK